MLARQLRSQEGKLDVQYPVPESTRMERAWARVEPWLGPEVLNAPALVRLQGISFLGLLDLQPDVRRTSSRLEHAVAVAALGCDVAEALHLSKGDGALLVAGCLLHDIGHYPLSHAAESAFEHLTGADHHERTRSILLEDELIAGIQPLGGTLRASGLDPEAVWQLIQGDSARADGLGFLLTAPINLDTLDGIRRTAQAFGLAALEMEQPFGLVDGRIVLRQDAIPACDAFWQLKNDVYRNIVERPSNILAEQSLAERLLELGPKDLPPFAALDDAWLHGNLRTSTDSARDAEFAVAGFEAVPARARRTLKRYWVDPTFEPSSSGLPIEFWHRRYQHARQAGYVIPRTSVHGRDSEVP